MLSKNMEITAFIDSKRNIERINKLDILFIQDINLKEDQVKFISN
jgi:hypothetical protein